MLMQWFGASPAHSDEPSQLDPVQIGSTGIVVGVETCMEGAKKSQPGEIERYYLKHCGCMLDYMRQSVGDNHLKFEQLAKKLNPSSLQVPVDTCAKFARQQEGKQQPEPTPYSSKLNLTSEQVFSGFLGCSRELPKKLSAKQANGFCGCVTDTLRTLSKKTLAEMQRRKAAGGAAASLLPEDKLAFCENRHGPIDDPDKPSVFLEMRSVASGKEVKQGGKVGQRTRVLDSPWSCSLRKPLTLHPAAGRTDTIPFDLELHTLECTNADAAIAFSLQCPTTNADFIAYTKQLGTKRLAENVVLVAQANGGQRRYSVTLLCE
ncbi:MAG: hypothetical protein AB7T06_20855 [Kofleriaceae bacterium]